MFRRKIVIPLVVIITLAIIAVSQYPKLYLATGYGAKSMASAVFIAGRDPLIVENTDLNYSIIKYTKSVIDYQQKSVTTSFLGLAKQTAVYRHGYGCCLVGDRSADSLQSLHFTPERYQMGGVWRIPWPNGDALKDTVFPEIDTTKLKLAIDHAFDEPGKNIKRSAAVVVLYKGELVGERYASDLGVSAETPLWGWSMTKSIMNTMAGVLQRQGKLDVKAVAPVEQWLNDARRNITINDLLQMNSGLKWDEVYSDLSPATRMLYHASDMYRSAIEVPLKDQPGTVWQYSSGTTNILSGIFRSLIANDSTYLQFPYREIFNRIGVTSMTIETDADANFVGSSYGYASARDWSRFGLLYYNDGVWRGDTILPPGWVNYTRTPAVGSEGRYGAQFWLNRSGEYPDAPDDLFSCEGHRGQRIFIIPSRKLVIVRLGFSEERFDHNNFLKEILAAIR